MYGPEGFNVGVNQGKVAGAGVEDHVHQHVVPRWGADTNFMPVIGSTRVLPQSLDDSYRALRDAFVTPRAWSTPPSSRPTTSAASTASRSTRTSPTASAAASRGCSASSRASRRPTCASASGATCGCAAPALSERYADGIRDEGADVLDVGEVGTEMLYFAVGSRDLDGGLMCTASHNPKAYTGAKLVQARRDRAVGRRGHRRAEGDRDGRRARRPAEPRGGYEREDVAEDFQAAARGVRRHWTRSGR